METHFDQQKDGGSIPTLPLHFLKGQWLVKSVPLNVAQRLTEKLHYSRGGSNTRTYSHGLFFRGFEADDMCVGICWWIPPTKSAAIATYPDDWRGVLSLSRMVVEEGVPKNACSFMLSKSMSMIDRARWPALVTYADEWQGHTGSVYLAANWTYIGRTKPEKTYTLNGRMLARKSGPKTRTHAQMIESGCELVGSFSKRKFVHIMSRSRKKTPITGITLAETEKEFKQQEHQRERARVRTALANFDDEAEVLPHSNQFGNPWDGPKDGRIYHGGTPYEKKAKKK